MTRRNIIIHKAGLERAGKILMTAIAATFFFACTKNVSAPEPVGSSRPLSLQLSASKLELLEGNANNRAINFSWTGNKTVAEHVHYTLEAAICGSGFGDPVEIGSGAGMGADFTVKEFNWHMRKILTTGVAGRVEFRVKFNMPHGAAPVYSDAVALNVTTYQPLINYDNSRIIRIPGNFQDWKLLDAPQVITTNTPGEYDGYIDFPNEYPQFVMVKSSTTWDPKTTFNYIGANKFGFGGSMFSIFGGSGAYRMKISTNTNTWSYTKINSWGLNGSAVSADSKTDRTMAEANDDGLKWSVTTDLVKGDFRLRANKNDEISFGHSPTDEIGVPSYEGQNIRIEKAGNYTITLELSRAGNYLYSIQKNK
jgi:hypothetical protein